MQEPRGREEEDIRGTVSSTTADTHVCCVHCSPHSYLGMLTFIMSLLQVGVYSYTRVVFQFCPSPSCKPPCILVDWWGIILPALSCIFSILALYEACLHSTSSMHS